MNKPSIGVAIITHNAERHLPHCLPPYLNASFNPKVLVVNSSSQDNTVALAKQMGAETLVVPRSAFNHGATRELARKHLGTDIVVMATPDAYPLDTNLLKRLIAPITEGRASVCYARQIPHAGADFFEAFAREFNYPATSHIRGIEDQKQYGVYTFFCSDSCAAYADAALESIGGFQPVLLGEDTLAAAKLLRQGHKIAYAADAVVRHSHRYTLKQEFQRCFDTGLARKQHAAILACPQSDAGRGRQFTYALIRKLMRENPRLIPYALLQTGCKFLGYQIGRLSVSAPLWLKKRLSSQDFFWENL